MYLKKINLKNQTSWYVYVLWPNINRVLLTRPEKSSLTLWVFFAKKPHSSGMTWLSPLKNPCPACTKIPKKKYFLGGFGSWSWDCNFVTNGPFVMFRPVKSSYGSNLVIPGVYGRSGCPHDTIIMISDSSEFILCSIWSNPCKTLTFCRKQCRNVRAHLWRGHGSGGVMSGRVVYAAVCSEQCAE